MLVIPSKEAKKSSQPNLGDTQGNLASSFCMDTTTNLSRIRSTRSLRVLDGQTFEDNNPGLDLDPAMAFAWYDYNNDGVKEFIAYMGVILYADNVNQPYAWDTSGPNYTNIKIGNGDMLVFNNKLYVTDASSLFSYDNQTLAWTNVTAANSITLGGGIHSMTAYGDLS